MLFWLDVHISVYSNANLLLTFWKVSNSCARANLHIDMNWTDMKISGRFTLVSSELRLRLN